MVGVSGGVGALMRGLKPIASKRCFGLASYLSEELKYETLCFPQPRSEGGPIASVLTQDHGEMFGLWAAGARSGQCPSSGVAVLHIDKHNDLEMPEPLVRKDRLDPVQKYADLLTGSQAKMDFRTHIRGAMRNNNFIYAAQAAGLVDHATWIQPDFPCGHCGYSTVESKCTIGRVTGGDPAYCFVCEGRQRYGSRCGDNVAADGLYEAYTGETHSLPMATALEDTDGSGWSKRFADSKRPWILDLDLDYFVPDEAAPKMAPMRYGGKRWAVEESSYFLNDEGAKELDVRVEETLLQAGYGLAQRNYPRVRDFRQWVCEELDECERVPDFMFELMKEAPTKPVAGSPDELDARIAQVAQVLRRIGTRPCLITVCRSNRGGYMTIADTPLIEAKALAMLRSVYGESNLPLQYTKSAMNLTLYPELARRLAEARVEEIPKNKFGERKLFGRKGRLNTRLGKVASEVEKFDARGA